ncbi:MAG TPA: peptide chain release factor 2 [Candidatus Saccharimonas sp.]|nr:peptide chain release factor 2 [Candidatus Saccharimonas sp.]
MQSAQKFAKELQKQVDDACVSLAIDQKQKQLASIDAQLADPDVWSNSSHAESLSREAGALRTFVEPWIALRAGIEDSLELLALDDRSLLGEVDQQLHRLEQEYNQRRKDLLFQGDFDDHAAIIKLSAGAGGTDAQDWTEMLERMYLRWAERAGMKTELIERSAGEEAGIKSVTYSVSGPFAYGKLHSEHGVHRLVRLSPFNSDNLRQTSFALVEVMPEIATPDEVKLDDKDLKIDVYRAGGHGGQSVNTTDSAVRVTHLPTGIVVAIQNERSQLQNKETALKILRSKLVQMQLDQHAETFADLRTGESASWGAQIRNYVLHPYTMVKDTRTKHEERNAQSVLDGDLEPFIEAYLTHSTTS